MNLDAYTVRKLAPKLLIAVVAVNISIYLCVAAIDITNIFGRGINQLISAPFMQAADSKFELDTLQGPDDVLIFFGITIAIGILLVLSTTGGQLLPMIALTMLPIVLAVLAVLVTLVVRKALLVLLTIVSPVAFALWVLPGTDKYFKQWWSLFLKTLMVYPIIAALFAITNIMAVVTFDSSTITQEEVIAANAPNTDPGQAGGAGQSDGFGTNALNAIIGIILVFIPLFMIPFAFKFAGGVLGSLSGRLSELQKPFARMAGRERQKRLGKRAREVKSGAFLKSRGKPEGSLRQRALWKATNGANAAAAGIANLPGDKQGIRPRNIAERMREAERAHLAEVLEKDEAVNNALGENDVAGAIIRAKDGSYGGFTQGLHDYVAGNGHKTKSASDKALKQYFKTDEKGNVTKELNDRGAQIVARAQEMHGKIGSFEGLQYVAGVGGSKTAPMWKDRYGEDSEGRWVRQQTASQSQNEWAAEMSGSKLTNRNDLVKKLKAANSEAKRSDLNGSGTAKSTAIDKMADAIYGTNLMPGTDPEEVAAQAQREFEDSLLTHQSIAEHISAHPEAAASIGELLDKRITEAEQRQLMSDDEIRASGQLKILPDGAGGEREETIEEFRERAVKDEVIRLATYAGGMDVASTSGEGAKAAWEALGARRGADGIARQDKMESYRTVHTGKATTRYVKDGDDYEVQVDIADLTPEQRAHNERAKLFRRVRREYGGGGDAEAAGRAAEAGKPPGT